VAFDSGPEAACFDVLRTNILRQMRANGWKRLAITSPTPGCGKTTTSLNLGFSLGRLHDLHTLVIEADLRRPAMRSCLRLKPKHMFATFMSGEAAAQDHLAAYGKGLAFGTNFGPLRNSAELLASQGVGEKLAELDRLYAADLTIFDMTPMLVSDDTIAFLHNVDCTLLVAAAGVTTTAQIDRCERALAEQTNVLGVVLNKCRYMAPDENYGYDYY
jgi:Mrp family chromosome partitioning ATPase